MMSGLRVYVSAGRLRWVVERVINELARTLVRTPGKEFACGRNIAWRNCQLHWPGIGALDVSDLNDFERAYFTSGVDRHQKKHGVEPGGSCALCQRRDRQKSRKHDDEYSPHDEPLMFDAGVERRRTRPR